MKLSKKEIYHILNALAEYSYMIGKKPAKSALEWKIIKAKSITIEQ